MVQFAGKKPAKNAGYRVAEARLHPFDHKVREHVQDMIDTNFKFFKQINDKPEFAASLNDLLFDRYAERKSTSPDLEKAPSS